jgi:hypothetical protein
MKRQLTYLLLPVLALALAALFYLLPTTRGQSDRGQCQQDCTRQYQECRKAANANQDACKRTFDACREACKNANTNTNGNINGNMNTSTPRR